MKRIAIIIYFILIVSSLTAQSKLFKKQQLIESDQLNTIMENNLNNDTLWVCDSVVHRTGEGEKYGKLSVLNRNILGNETLSKFNMIFDPEGISEYSFIDSTSYFSDNKTINKESHNVYIASSNSLETSQYHHFESPEVKKEEFIKFYSSSSEEFDGGYKRFFINNNGNPDTLHSYILLNNNTWQNHNYCKYYYDSSGNDTLHVYRNWKENEFVDSLKYRRVFNSGFLKQIYELKWDDFNSIWVNKSHQYYSYNSLGLVDTNLQQTWISNESYWRDEAKSIVSYDENSRINTYLSKLYDYNTQQLENYMISTHNYEDNNHTIVVELWEDNEWVNYFKTFYSYFDEEKIDTAMRISWVKTLNKWQPDHRGITRYDFRDNAKEYLRQDYVNDQWQTTKTYQYYWSVFNTSFITSQEHNKLRAYPNPSSTHIDFKFDQYPDNNSTLYIYNIAGQKIDEITLSKEGTVWDCSGVIPGVYIYSVICDGDKSTGKIVVK